MKAIEFSDKLMATSVKVLFLMHSLLTSCDAYIQGMFDSVSIVESEVFSRYAV